MKTQGVCLALAGAAVLFSAGLARADLAPPPASPESQPLLLAAAGLLVVLVLWLLIRGALSLSRRDGSDGDDAGVGVLEGIDEDDDDRKKKR
jgi:hypothetical protein